MFSNKGLFRYRKAASFETLGHEPPVTVFRKHDGLPGDEVNRIFEDSHGDLWISIADIETGLARWQRTTGTLHTYSEADGFSSPHTKVSYPSAFAEDHAGNIWIGFDAGGLVRYAAGTFATFDGGQAASGWEATKAGWVDWTIREPAPSDSRRIRRATA